MCNNNLFRTLTPDEIECRVAQGGQNQKGKWGSYLLYKDARVDQRIMDETFGATNWEAIYSEVSGMLFCTVRVWDADKGAWISKMNVGTESNTEAEKGLVSDCLKRACFTWGLGVELYSAPKIFVSLNEGEYSVKGDKVYPTLNLKVAEIAYEDRRISRLVLKDNKGNERFNYGAPQGAKSTPPDVFYSNDGKKLVKGDKVWQYAVAKTAQGETCEDGTPIPIWLADYYNVPDAVMKEFINDVNRVRNETK